MNQASSSQRMVANWKNGHHSLTRIECHSENSKGVYCLQYDDKKIVSGLRDNTIKVSPHTRSCCFKGINNHISKSPLCVSNEPVMTAISCDGFLCSRNVKSCTGLRFPRNALTPPDSTGTTLGVASP